MWLITWLLFAATVSSHLVAAHASDAIRGCGVVVCCVFRITTVEHNSLIKAFFFLLWAYTSEKNRNGIERFSPEKLIFLQTNSNYKNLFVSLTFFPPVWISNNSNLSISFQTDSIRQWGTETSSNQRERKWGKAKSHLYRWCSSGSPSGLC